MCCTNAKSNNHMNKGFRFVPYEYCFQCLFYGIPQIVKWDCYKLLKRNIAKSGAKPTNYQTNTKWNTKPNQTRLYLSRKSRSKWVNELLFLVIICCCLHFDSLVEQELCRISHQDGDATWCSQTECHTTERKKTNKKSEYICYRKNPFTRLILTRWISFEIKYIMLLRSPFLQHLQVISL